MIIVDDKVLFIAYWNGLSLSQFTHSQLSFSKVFTRSLQSYSQFNGPFVSKSLLFLSIINSHTYTLIIYRPKPSASSPSSPLRLNNTIRPKLCNPSFKYSFLTFLSHSAQNHEWNRQSIKGTSPRCIHHRLSSHSFNKSTNLWQSPPICPKLWCIDNDI